MCTQSLEEAQRREWLQPGHGREGVVGVAGTKEGFREEQPRRIWRMRKNLVGVRDGVGGGLGPKMEE